MKLFSFKACHPYDSELTKVGELDYQFYLYRSNHGQYKVCYKLGDNSPETVGTHDDLASAYDHYVELVSESFKNYNEV